MELVGSIASMAMRLPCDVKCFPKASINVLFPTPGTPVMPILIDLLACGKQAFIMVLACSKCLWFSLSTKVIARLKAAMFLLRIEETKVLVSIRALRFALRVSMALELVISGEEIPVCSESADLFF